MTHTTYCHQIDSETQPNSAEISTEKQDRVSGGITHEGCGGGGVDVNSVLHVAGGRGGMSVSKSWPCCSGCGGWWRRPLVCWSAPSCQILLLVAGARLAGPSRKGASVWPSSAAAVAVAVLAVTPQGVQTLSREFQPHLAHCESDVIPTTQTAD